MKPRIVPRTPASSGVDQPSSSRCSESAAVISLVMALSPSAAANRRFGFQIKPEITPPPIPTNPGTAPFLRMLIRDDKWVCIQTFTDREPKPEPDTLAKVYTVSRITRAVLDRYAE